MGSSHAAGGGAGWLRGRGGGENKGAAFKTRKNAQYPGLLDNHWVQEVAPRVRVVTVADICRGVSSLAAASESSQAGLPPSGVRAANAALAAL